MEGARAFPKRGRQSRTADGGGRRSRSWRRRGITRPAGGAEGRGHRRLSRLGGRLEGRPGAEPPKGETQAIRRDQAQATARPKASRSPSPGAPPALSVAGSPRAERCGRRPTETLTRQAVMIARPQASDRPAQSAHNGETGRPSSRPIGSGTRSEAVAGAPVRRDQAQATARPKASWSPSPGAPPALPVAGSPRRQAAVGVTPTGAHKKGPRPRGQ